mmetsp:Transcript_11327/g.31564  ORF Transcript_11327/g.31564 Transcript_11327/m.31564 type:complete len:107 (+) Transcript_11327:153-473(+)
MQFDLAPCSPVEPIQKMSWANLRALDEAAVVREAPKEIGIQIGLPPTKRCSPHRWQAVCVQTISTECGMPHVELSKPHHVGTMTSELSAILAWCHSASAGASYRPA